jgi:hypothetical protein
MKDGKGRLGGSGASAIKEVPFDQQYHCYVLLYLFVNHTSLDNPMPVNDESIDDGLLKGLNKGAWQNLEQTNIKFGE